MLTDYERSRLLYAAKVCTTEADTWRDGFAVKQPDGTWTWTEREYDWAHLRAMHLDNAARFLSKLAAKKETPDSVLSES